MDPSFSRIKHSRQGTNTTANAACPSFCEWEQSLLARARRSGYVFSDEVQQSSMPRASAESHLSAESAQARSSAQVGQRKASPDFTFEDFRRPDTPPPVFLTRASDHKQVSPDGGDHDDVTASGNKSQTTKRRGINFSKSLPRLRRDSSISANRQSDEPSAEDNDSNSDGPNTSFDTIQRSNTEILSEPDDPAGSGAALEEALVKTIQRSSTTSSVEEWLGLKKSRNDQRISTLARRRQPASHEPLVSESLPRISTFRTERDHRALNRKLGLAEDSTGSVSQDAPSASHSAPLPTSKKERPRFLRSISRKSLQSMPSTPTGETSQAQDPIINVPNAGEQSPLKSPSRVVNSLFWHSKKASQEGSTKGPMLATSRRRGHLEDASTPYTPSFSSPLSPPLLLTPDLSARSSAFPREPSSDISPGDTTTRHDVGQKIMTLEQDGAEAIDLFGKACLESDPTTKLQLKGPPRRSRWRQHKAPEFLPSEARRVNTPPAVKPGKGNKLMGDFMDNWHQSGQKRDGRHSDMDAVMHTPFPMPRVSTSVPSTPLRIEERDYDWYRSRADRIVEDDEPLGDDIEELRAQFDWDVPDHLPTSPLCPANPKHKSGGTGICVYHGRAK